MALRLAALGVWHEANTFAPRGVDADGLARVVRRGTEIDGDGATTMAGYLRLPETPGYRDVEVVPLIQARLTPAGPLSAAALQTWLVEARRLLISAGPWDGVLLELHGACVAESHCDADGEVLRTVREIVGPTVPIGAGLDLHANISLEMACHATVLNVYRTNPHVDADVRGLQIARIVADTAAGTVRPTMALRQVPAAINILRQGTADAPMSELVAAADAIESRPGVLSAGVAEGFPYADVEELGMSVLVVTDDDPAAAASTADALADRVWDRRADFLGDAPGPQEAVRRAVSAPRPVLLLDVGDNIGGGTNGDSVVLLAELRRHKVPAALSIVNASAAAARCHQVGVGRTVSLSIGNDDGLLDLDATVLALHHGRYAAEGPTHAGQSTFDTGPTAAVGYDTDSIVVLTSRPDIPSSLTQLRELGIETGDRTVIVAKGVHSPLVGYRPIAQTVIWVDTPGPTRADFTALAYQHRRRPLFPFENP